MSKWIFAIGAVLIGLVFLLSSLFGGAPSRNKVTKVFLDAGIVEEPQEIEIAKRKPTPQEAEDAGAEIEKIAISSDEFNNRVDVMIPDRLRASLAYCPRQGMDPNAKIIINYKLLIDDGVVSVSHVEIAESELENPELERCMLENMRQATWRADDLPDFTEDDDVFIRIRSLNKYLTTAEQIAAKKRDNTYDGPEDDEDIRHLTEDEPPE